MLLHTLDNSFLAKHRPPRLTFADSPRLPEAVRPVWSALRAGDVKQALRSGYKLLRANDLDQNVRAAVLAGLAQAELEHGVSSVAKQLAYDSLSHCKQQWLAHRVLLTAHVAEKDYETARRLLETIDEPKQLASWDEPLSETECHVLRAACTWMTHDWDAAAGHLGDAYPAGVTSMPTVLQEDWFRLAFYREQPDDAAAAAQHLIADHTIEKADLLIQTLVRQGWHKQALALYRRIYDQDPGNELLRRRVVGLCIREGEVNEARRLMELGALRLAV